LRGQQSITNSLKREEGKIRLLLMWRKVWKKKQLSMHKRRNALERREDGSEERKRYPL